jgi:hypothetical protein
MPVGWGKLALRRQKGAPQGFIVNAVFLSSCAKRSLPAGWQGSRT